LQLDPYSNDLPSAAYSNESQVEKEKDWRIVNGWNSKWQWTFYVMVWAETKKQYEYEYNRCGGTIVSQHMVLTAAHCVFNLKWYHMFVDWKDFRKGTKDPWRAEVMATNKHGKYKGDNNVGYGYDIALLYVEKDLYYYNKLSIPVCQLDSYKGYNINIIGLGAVDEGGTKLANRLKHTLVIHRGKHCGRIHEDRQLCLSSKYKRDACTGDSGGPAFPEKKHKCIYGIVSYGAEKCGPYTVYTKAKFFRDWINHRLNYDNWWN